MNRIIQITLTLLIHLGITHGQNRCDKNLEIAQEYLEKRKNMQQGLRDEIKRSLDSCPTNDGPSYYVRGLLELRTQPNPNYLEAFNYFKTAAQYNHTKAKTYLGYFYKNGWSTPTNRCTGLDKQQMTEMIMHYIHLDITT